MQDRKLIRDSDIELFRELGFQGCSSVASCKKVIDSLKLRQLDKLKTILFRFAFERFFSDVIVDGIGKNDLETFSLAMSQMNALSLENTN